MAVDYLEVMSTLGAIAGKHPQTTSLLMQTYSLWSENITQGKKIVDEYRRAAGQASGKFDTAGILMQLAALHPDAAKLLTQTITMWQARIPDLLQVIDEFQTASVAAYRS